jgi:hypothetical protein
MPVLLVGTRDGLHRLDVGDNAFAQGKVVTALTRQGMAWWAICDRREIWSSGEDGSFAQTGAIVGDEATCMMALPDALLIGTAGAHLLRLEGRSVEHVAAFDKLPGRDRWYTPWGGPPDTRSMATDGSSGVWINVHVGGIVRSLDAGRTFEPTALDIDSDVHQVILDGGELLAATAVGLASSIDGGESWIIEDEGLHATYLRAVGVAGGWTLVSASEGPDGERSCLYRKNPDRREFERCSNGLPEWFGDNIDTGCLATSGHLVAIGTTQGTLFLSADCGENWLPVSVGLPPVTCLAIV